MQQLIQPRGGVWPRYILLGAALSLLLGCGTMALRDSFEDYSAVYAQTQNQQMLLNLARLSDREPIYFFQLAQISAAYTFSGTFGLSDSKVIGLASTNVSHTSGATLGGTATHNPIFTLVPLGGDKFASQLLAPIKPEIFYELFEEGWPIDLLMRVLIERIELVQDTTPDAPAPPAGAPVPAAAASADAAVAVAAAAGERLEVMVNDPLASAGGHYDRFLRACALARQFQQAGILYLDISDKFEPLASGAFFVRPPTDQQMMDANKAGLVWQQDLTAQEKNLTVADPPILQPADTLPPKPDAGVAEGENGDKGDKKAADGTQVAVGEPGDKKVGDDAPAVKGAAPGPEKTDAAFELQAGNWQLGKMTKQTLFKLNKESVNEALTALAGNPELQGNDDLITKFYSVLKNGIGVTDTQTAKNDYKARLVMRSLIGAMLALANEQANFKSLDTFRDSVEGRNLPQQISEAKARADSKALPGLIESSMDVVPAAEDHPVLILEWPAKYSTEASVPFDPNAVVSANADTALNALRPFPMAPATKVVSVSYKGKTYAIGDPAGITDPTLATWNRDVFRLLVQLSLQVTADPSTFALPSLLQSH